MHRRQFLAGSGAAILGGCTTFDHHTFERTACDFVALPLHTGVNHGQSRLFDPVMLATGQNDSKWVYNGISGPSNNARPTVAGPMFQGVPAPANALWLTAPDETKAPNAEGRFTYCFCVRRPNTDAPSLRISELNIRTSHIINRVMFHTGDILAGNGGTSFTFDPNNPSHTSHENAIVDGINCLDVHIIKTQPDLQPLAISVSGFLTGINCCES